MEKSVKIRKIMMFVGTGIGAYLVMWLLGQGGKAWDTVRGNVTQQLTVLLSGGLAGIFAMLIPSQNKPQTPAAPHSPGENPPTGGTPATLADLPESEWETRCNTAELELNQWRNYGHEVNLFHAQQEQLRVLLDTRQAMLRVTLISIVVLAFVVSIFSYFGPPLPQEGTSNVAQDVFMSHISWVAGAHALVGFVMGAVVFRIRIHTLHRHAFRSALIGAFVLNLTSMLMVTPYAFAMMWKQQVQLFGFMQPMLVCTTGFRIFIAPLLCGVLSLAGFQLAKSFSRGV